MPEAIPIRNVVLLGHSHSGKTQLAEAMLAVSGAIPAAGRVDQGTSVSDYHEDEKGRKISINSSILNFTKGDTRVNLIDAPGYGDFMGETVSAVEVSDGVILVINATGGIEIGTNTALKLIAARNLPAVIFINRMDKEHADFKKCLEGLEARIGKKCACFTYPIGEESSFKGVADLMTGEGLDKVSPDEEKDNAKKLQEALKENIAESNDALLEKYLEKET